MHTLEAIGLLLAFLDFFDLAAKLEKLLEAVRLRISALFELLGALAIKSDQTINAETKAQARVRSIAMAIICGIPALLISGLMAYRSITAFAEGKGTSLIDPGKKAFGLIPAGGVGELVTALVVIPFVFVTVFFFTAMLLVLCISAVYYLALVPVMFALEMMHKARRGIVGSIGLIIAVISFLSR